MEQGTLEERRTTYLKAIVLDASKMSGSWELKIKISNTQGTKAFGGRKLGTYKHPLTGIDTPLINLNFQDELGLMIDRPTMIFHPDTDLMHRRVIDWLISHPEVGVEGLNLTEQVKSKKISNPSIHIKNLDIQKLTEIDDEDEIDVVIGKLSDDNPKTGLSLEKLRYLLAHFNLPYYDLRYIKNKITEKKMLRQKMKHFARAKSSTTKSNASAITEVLEQIENLKYTYEFKEMLRHDIIVESYGTYKFDNVPLGTNQDSVILWMKTNLEIYSNMVSRLYPILKEEGFAFKDKKEPTK